MRGGAPEASLDAIAAALRRYERQRFHVDGFRDAAVLVPVVPRPEGLDLVFTVRSAHLSRHAGQISFPGGALEPGEDVIDGALRETHEEIGVALPRGNVLGLLDDQPSPAGFVATPVVVVLDPDARFTVDPNEVADVFTAPVRELADIAPSWEERRLEHFRRRIHYYPWSGRLIWGFTGNVLKNFLDIAAVGAQQDGASAAAGKPKW